MHDISVVMACFNGEKVIKGILDSLVTQTRLPEEILILDDCSTDSTVSVIRRYMEEYRDAGWKLEQNTYNLGWKQNFMQGLKCAKGDLIFLCDQDDLWDTEKIRMMENTMDQYPEINILACDYDIQYEPGSVPMKKYKKSPREKTGEAAGYQFTTRFFQNPSPGCTYAVRKAFLDRVKDYWFPEAPHDEFLWLMAAMEDGAWFLNKKLMTMRRGASNASDIKYKDIRLQQENLNYISTMLEKMSQYANCDSDLVDREKKEMLKKAQLWCKKRQRLMSNRNPFYWLAMMPYWKYYNSFRNCLSDLYLVLFGSFRRNSNV